MNTAEMHTIEHLGATFKESRHLEKCFTWTHGVQDRFLSASGGDYQSEDILPLMVEMYEFIRDFQGRCPGRRQRTAVIIWI